MKKRLKTAMECRMGTLPHSALEGVGARQEESERILKRLGSDHFVILLDEQRRAAGFPLLKAHWIKSHLR